MVGEQGAGDGELRVGRGEREARRYGIAQPSAPPPAADQRLALAACRRGRVAQPGGAKVHQRLARHDPQPARQRGLEQCVDGGAIDRREHERACRAVPQQFGQKGPRDGARMAVIGKGHFGGEDVPRQPVEQLLAV